MSDKQLTQTEQVLANVLGMIEASADNLMNAHHAKSAEHRQGMIIAASTLRAIANTIRTGYLPTPKGIQTDPNIHMTPILSTTTNVNRT